MLDGTLTDPAAQCTLARDTQRLIVPGRRHQLANTSPRPALALHLYFP